MLYTGRPSFGDPKEMRIGQVVYLFPNTPQAGPACHQLRTVKVMRDPALFWPHVMVEWEEGGVSSWAKVHRDNIRSKPYQAPSREDKAQGDTVGGSSSKPGRVRVMPSAKKYEPLDGQESLF
jgi:hypothetical protein